jgi:hypothetical protein
MPRVTVRGDAPHHLPPVLASHVLRRVAVSGHQAGPESVSVSGAKSAATHRLAAEVAAAKSGAVKAAAIKATTSVETTAAKATMEAAAMETASPAAARGNNVGCKRSKRCSRQQRDHDFTEHD